MGGKSGSGGGSNQSSFQASTSTYTPNPEAMAAYRRAISMAENVTSQPFQPYQGQMVAGFTPDQMAAFQGVRNTQGMVQPYINTATNLTQNAVNLADPRNFGENTLQQYYNPYQQNVIDATMRNLEATQAMANKQAQQNAGLRGAFGGSSGSAMARAEVARQQSMANAQTLAGLQQTGYQQAVGQYNQQQQQAIQTAQNAAYGLGQLGNQAQQASLQGLQALLGTGGQQQQMAQGQLTGAYNQWLQAQAFPYQQAAFYSGIAGGIAPNMGGTTNTIGFGTGQTQQQQAQGGGGGAGSIMSLMSMLPAMFSGSDERTKTNVEPWGEPDPETGLQAYSYDDIGDLERSYETGAPMPPKRVSYMAQDVEDVYPDAVSDLGGLKAIKTQRNRAADGGAQGNTLGSLGPAAGTNPASSASSIYSPATSPAAANIQPGAMGEGAAAASGAPSGMDPGMQSFLAGAFDPRTADQMARAKWVNQPQPLAEQQYTGDNFTIPPALMNDGGASYENSAYRPQPGSPMARGGRTLGDLREGYAGGGMPWEQKGIGSPFDMIAKSKAGGPFTDAPNNYIGESQNLGIGQIIPQGKDVAKSITGQAAESMMHQLQSATKGGGGGGGGSGGGGGGAPKMPKMPTAKSGKQAGLGALGAEGDQAATETPVSDGKPEANTPAVPEAAPAAPEPGLGAGALDAAAAAPAADFAAAVPPIPEIPMLGMFGGFRDGGRVQKDGGGAAGGPGGPALGGPDAGAFAPADMTSPNLGAGLGDLVLGKAPTWGDAAGFGNIKQSQEKLTGEDLMGKYTKQYWERDPGEQKTPEQQGMPAMPGEKFYQTPRKDLPSVTQTEHYGEQVPSPVPGLMMMAGMGSGGGFGGLGKMGTMGLAMEINQQNQARDAQAKQAELKATREQMLSDPANFPVQGYFSSIDSTPAGKPEMGMQINPRTGLYNMKYTGAYRGYPYADGGRVGRAPGGRMQGPPMPYDPTEKDYLNLARTMHFEAANQGDLGMLAVGHVARNRFESGRYGATPSDVVTAVNKRGVAQFTPWGTKGQGSNRPIANYQPTEHELALAKQALTEADDPTKGATHYYNPKISHPAWGKGMENQVQIGAHRFGTTAGGKSGGFPMMARGPVTSPAEPAAQTRMAAGPSTPKQSIPEYTPNEIKPQLMAQGSGSTPGGLGDIATATPPQREPIMAADNAPQGGLGDMASADMQGPEMPDIDIPERADGGRLNYATRGGVSINRSGGSTYGGTQYGIGQLYDIMRQAGATPREAAQMAAVAIGESSGWSAAHNPNRKTGDNSYGLWQINMLGKLGPARMRKYGLNSVDDLADPVTNARIALDLLRHGGGLRNWGAFNKQTSPYRHAMAQVSRVFPELAQRPVGFTPQAAQRAVPYQPEMRPLAFKPAEGSPVVAKDSGFTPAAATATPLTYANATPAQRAQMTREAEANAAAQRNALAAASRKPGFSLGNYIAPPAQAADKDVLPGDRPLHPVDQLGLTKQPGGYSFTRQPEWYTQKTHGAVKDYRDPYGAGYVTSNDFPMDSRPMDEIPPEESAPAQPAAEPIAAKDEKKAAPQQQMYWGDYRDVENNPFGDFIDELAGDVRSSRKAGTATTPMGKFAGLGGLGQLFDMEGTLPYDLDYGAAAPRAPSTSSRSAAPKTETNPDWGKTLPYNGPPELKPEQGPPMPDNMQKEADEENAKRKYIMTGDARDTTDFGGLFDIFG